MASQIPIVFIHFSDDLYLEVSLRQAKFYNPETEIYLISPVPTHAAKFPFVQHINSKDYYTSAQKAAQLYYHQSPNSYEFELNCIVRWFILLDFARKQKLGQLLHLDSDVLLYTTPEFIASLYLPARLTLSNGQSPHCLLVKDVDTLAAFCDTILRYYENKEKDEHVSDMFFFKRFASLHPLKVCELMQVKNGYVVDNNISNGDGYEEDEQGKKVFLKDHAPYFVTKSDQTKIKVLALHFQGSAKKRMAQYASSPIHWLLKAKLSLYWKIKKAYSLFRQ